MNRKFSFCFVVVGVNTILNAIQVRGGSKSLVGGVHIMLKM